ncbi:glycosyl transferase [Oscillatoriales cyanobacterium USR001]|nr:glycosyl transferase [Oscillatoriales cyanobacterium USR001]
MQESSWSQNSDSLSEFSLENPELAQEEQGIAEDLRNQGILPSEPNSLLPSFPHHLYRGRRGKAAVALTIIWGGTISLHLVSWGAWVIWGLTGLLWIQAFRVLLARPKPTPPPLNEATQENWPYISLLVAAKNEEAVIGDLVKTIASLDYPTNRYELWVIDDYSVDKTPEILAQLKSVYPQLRVFRREANAVGGKSGALNQVLPLTKGEILGVFDADAIVTPDLLRRVLPLFEREEVGAVQVRKAIANASLNFWTRGQESEMALDSFFQQQRTAIGGIGELRGNGQFVRRSALDSCGGWNEETITDDLDLTIRLHLDQWDIEFLAFPPVSEEGVTTTKALWHQRNRWAEGGYQRYLDYWRLIFRNLMGTGKTWDLFGFCVTQYLLPTAAIPDALMSILFRRLPITTPLTVMTITLSLVGMFVGLRRTRRDMKLAENNVFVNLWPTLRGTFYMLHWLIVMGSVTARISVRPKQLKWVKTIHQGSDSA